jgi:hypothetical protein
MRSSGFLSMLNKHPSAPRYEGETRKSRDDLARRYDFLQQHEDCERGNPEKIHDTTDEQERHQGPATANTIEAVTQAERQSAAPIAAEAPVAQDKCERRLAMGQAHFLERRPLIKAGDD